MPKMELRIRICEKSFAGQSKYEIIVPLYYSDTEIIAAISGWLRDIRKAEAQQVQAE